MTPEEKIDDALDSVLRASGSSLKNYSMDSTLKAMRNAMRKAMVESYILGSNDCYEGIIGEVERLRIRLDHCDEQSKQLAETIAEVERLRVIEKAAKYLCSLDSFDSDYDAETELRGACK